MEIEYLTLAELQPYEHNAKIHTDKQIEEIKLSIERFGFNDPIGIWSADNVIVEGHGRFLAAKELGMYKVPCIRLDNLTDEERQAYTLVHNQLTMNTGYDKPMLEIELSKLEEFHMEDFEFDMSFLEPKEPKEKSNERTRTYEAYNLLLFDEYDADGFYQMPMIYKEDVVPDKLIGFNYMKSSTDTDVGIHMYVDDYQFERLWNKPEAYLDELRQFQCVFTPDFSLYLDMPMAMKIWNVYRSRMLGQYWQRNGIQVIPTISWAEEETFQFCFDGVEQGSIVSISTIGVKRDEYAYQIWSAGVKAMKEHIQPSMILVYGGKLDFDYGDIPVKYYENAVTERMKTSRTKGNGE